MTKGKGHMCALVPQSRSDTPCSKPMDKAETYWPILYRLLLSSLYVPCLFTCISPLALHSGFHFPLFCLFPHPHLLTLLFQLDALIFSLGSFFLSK